MKILWFRRDLRVSDNPLLSSGGEVLPIFIFDKNILSKLASDDKRVSFIFESVMKLKQSLQEIALDLKIFFDEPKNVFEYLQQFHPESVVASGDYDSYSLERDKKISRILHFEYVEDTYIFSPNEILKSDGTPYVVFTPFYNQAKKVFSHAHLREYKRASNRLFKFDYDSNITLEILGFKEFKNRIEPLNVLLKKLPQKLVNYSDDRDYLDKDGTSKLSLYLRFGLLGIRELLRVLVEIKKGGVDTEPFFRQLLFREFYAYLLYHFPYLEKENFRYDFKGEEDIEKYERFCSGATGVPIVDASINELLQTGYMHNRARMVSASFFTKDLLLPWQWGEKFFASHLLDYDSASNILSWQWSSSTGVDAQPYFRVFNPYLQSKKFDKDAIYIKKHLKQALHPEGISHVEPKSLHVEDYLFKRDIQNYPKPIVRHKVAAAKAIEIFKNGN